MKKNIFIMSVASLLSVVLGFVFTNSSKYIICDHIDYNCRELFNNIGDPLFYGAGALFIVFVLLLIMPKAVEPWKKFAVWYVPLATLLFIFYPEPRSGDLFSPYPEQIFIWTSSLYVLISILLIGYKYIKNRKLKNLN